jgi:zinc transporter ZupT
MISFLRPIINFFVAFIARFESKKNSQIISDSHNSVTCYIHINNKGGFSPLFGPNLSLAYLLRIYEVKLFWLFLNFSLYGTTSHENLSLNNSVYDKYSGFTQHYLRNMTPFVVFFVLVFANGKNQTSKMIVAIPPGEEIFTYGRLISYAMFSNKISSFELYLMKGYTTAHVIIENHKKDHRNYVTDNKNHLHICLDQYKILEENQKYFFPANYIFVGFFVLSRCFLNS